MERRKEGPEKTDFLLIPPSPGGCTETPWEVGKPTPFMASHLGRPGPSCPLLLQAGPHCLSNPRPVPSESGRGKGWPDYADSLRFSSHPTVLNWFVSRLLLCLSESCLPRLGQLWGQPGTHSL